jgi:type IV secretory pathway VirB2 component (pilin)
VALYAWLEPAYGVFQALGIVGGVLAVIALVSIGAAMIAGRGRRSSRRH